MSERREQNDGRSGRSDTLGVADVAVPVSLPGQAAPVGAVATRGAAWAIGLTVAAKITGVVGQILLAALLLKEDFGLYFMGLGVTSVTGVLAMVGVRQVLVNRQRRWHLWVNAGFWMSTVLGLLGAVLTVLLTPVAMWLYGVGTELLPVLIWLAVAMFATVLGTVPNARLQVELRFRAVAILGWVSVVAAMGMSVLMAWLGWGALSFAVPAAFAAAFRSGGMWYMTWPKVRLTLQLRRWRYLVADTSYLTVSNALWSISSRMDSTMLGVFHAKPVVGTYGFAYNLSVQTVQMMVTNIQNVMFAALNKLKDEPDRQAAGFLRAARVVLMAGVPLSMMQAAAVDPAVRLLYGEKWVDAIGLIQLLSAGSVLGMMYGPCMSLLEAQGRFRLSMVMTAITGSIFVIAVTAGAVLQGPMGVAVGVVVYWALTGLMLVKVGLGGLATWFGREGVVRLFAVPVSLGLVAGAAGFATTMLFPDTKPGYLMACGSVVLVTGGLYLGLSRLVARAWYDELMGVARQLAGPALARFRR